ncbi:FAD/NAD(P)-binding domain-containing protein [Nemania sp. FL0031]|nr:FAD/NAD(P)-binding domain-containing protein [Nemania sp. FL0031]
MAPIISILASTPLALFRYLLDIIRFLLPRGRPVKEWTLLQAILVRSVRLILLYWSLFLAGDRLTLKAGRERARFEVISPKSLKLYQGPLNDTDIHPETIGATWTPARPQPAAITDKTTVVLHFHGGAFVIGDGRDHDAGFVARTLVQHMGCAHVCSPQYRLSTPTSGRFPAALQDALTSYLHLTQDMGIPASQIVLSGDSAGGTIVLGLLRYISEHGQKLSIPAPAAAALWSPWTDVHAALDPNVDVMSLMSSMPNYASDYVGPEFVRWGALAVTGHGAIDGAGPYLSPQHHPFRMGAEVPLFVNAGGGEVLCDTIKAFCKSFENEGWPVRLVISEGCPHDIALLGLRIGFQEEAEAAVRDARVFFSSMTALHLHFDVVIIGAGFAGINAAYRIQNQGPPGMKYVVLEGRDSVGGTWDLFRYPGIRSDSDIFTFGFAWSQWKHNATMATGRQIKDYISQSVHSTGIDQHIRYHHKVKTADWDSTDKSWTLQVSVEGKEKPAIFRSPFVLLGTGYYDYEMPRQTIIPGLENFRGKVIHPQFWPEDYDYTGKEIVVIGSGATAVTLVPSLAEKSKRVTMLQRSPGYIASLASSTFFTRLLFAILPAAMAQKINRVKWLIQSWLTNLLCKYFPERAKKVIKKATIEQLPPSIKWDPHFKPRYNPWEQRFCACMDGDFFAALRSGKADVVTDTIKTVTANSIELESGAALHPDIIVTATGLKLNVGGGIQFSVDGRLFKVADKFTWRGTMLEDVPNLIFMAGYQNASWTLGTDVSVQLFLRLLRAMKRKNAQVVVARPSAPMEEAPTMTLTSTYFKVSEGGFPRAGTGQWSPKSSYFADMAGAKWGSITDIHFS